MCYLRSAEVQQHESEGLLILWRRLGLALPGERPGVVCLQAFLTCYRSSGRSVYRHVLSRPRALSFKALLQVGFGANIQFCVIGHEEQDAEVNFKALRQWHKQLGPLIRSIGE